MRVLSLSATATAAIQFQSQQQSPLTKGVFPATRGAFSISTRTHICFPQRRRQLLFFKVKSVESSSTVDELQDFRVVPSNVLTTEKQEATAVLTMFLETQIGLTNAAAAATISKSVPFIDHLVARLHSIKKNRYPVGRELTTLEIRDSLIPYLEYLCEEHEDSFDDVMENFLIPPDEECEDHRDCLDLDDVVENFSNSPEEEQEPHISATSQTNLPLDSKKLKAMARITEIGTNGQLPPITLDLMDIGLDMDQINEMACKHPYIIKREIKPLIEFFLDLGVLPSDIAKILYKAPRLCSFKLYENIIPSMKYLETLGMDKSKRAKAIRKFPHLLLYSRQKVEATVDYLYELGLSRNRIRRVLQRRPQIITYSIDDNLRPTAEYFRSMGVNPMSLVLRFPEVLSRSIERKLKPVTEFFLDKGYSINDIGTMALRSKAMYCSSLTKNLTPKWDFFLTMDYPRLELVKYPSYFAYSLEGRIKPRYAQMKKCGVKLSFKVFIITDSEFEKILNRRMMKMVDVPGHDYMTNIDDYIEFGIIR